MSPFLWWSPDPRLLLYPGDIYVSRRLKRMIRQQRFAISCDKAFYEVISACAGIRTENCQETWIGEEMMDAYCRLFDAGYAHSMGSMAGRQTGRRPLRGVAGRGFFGESMFSRVANSSKIALVALCRFLNALSFDFIDCQVKTDHLEAYGRRRSNQIPVSQSTGAIHGPEDIKRKLAFCLPTVL
ncbi:MAG: leucyl/phenylalanyl-tRNA--protein transferase [Desulfobacterales bacterium]